MPKVKPLGKVKPTPKPQTRLEKNEKRATVMETTLRKAIEEQRQRQFDEYVEWKMLKGHTREEAEHMAKKQVFEHFKRSV